MHERDVFDRWLEDGLRRALRPVASRRSRSLPRYRTLAASRRGRRLSLLGGASGALGLKLLTGLTVAAFAVGVTGTAISGTPNPAQWRSQVGDKVEQCQGDLSGQSGIGGCVIALVAPPSATPREATPSPDSDSGGSSVPPAGPPARATPAHPTPSAHPAPPPHPTPHPHETPGHPTPPPHSTPETEDGGSD